MIAAEYTNSVSTVRIHDEFCEAAVDSQISKISRLISKSYMRRQLESRENRTDIGGKSNIA